MNPALQNTPHRRIQYQQELRLDDLICIFHTSFLRHYNFSSWTVCYSIVLHNKEHITKSDDPTENKPAITFNKNFMLQLRISYSSTDFMWNMNMNKTLLFPGSSTRTPLQRLPFIWYFLFAESVKNLHCLLKNTL